MRIRKKPWAQPELDRCSFYAKSPENNRGKWSLQFKKEQPLHLELGCGKGLFISQCALNNPNINFLAIDIKSDMLGVARRTITKLFEENQREVDNIILIAYNVEQIDKILSPDDRIERIYINFCNPWLRPKHKKRRLTFPRKLELYKNFLTNNGEIHFKTDDEELFRESIDYFKSCSFKISFISENLHSHPQQLLPKHFTTYETEHEKMFTALGKPTFCCFVKKQNLKTTKQ